MPRPNLAGRPFENSRPVWIAGTLMAIVAVALSAINISEALGARDSERIQGEKLQSLTRTRTELVKSIESTNRELARVPWKKLQAETTSLQIVVARRSLSWSQLLVDLERILPWDVRLQSIDPNVMETGEIRINLRGVAATREAWLNFIRVLFADDRFSSPVPQFEESPGASGMQGYTFALEVRYDPGSRS